MARNHAPIPITTMHWIMLWANTEVTWDRSPPTVESPDEIVTAPSDHPQAMSSRIAKRTQ